MNTAYVESKKSHRKLIGILLICVIALTLVLGIQLGRTLIQDDDQDYNITLSYGGNSQNPTNQSVSLVSQPSYTIFADGGTYFARNGTSGAVTQSSNASWLVNTLIDSLPSYGGMLQFCSGIFEFSNSIVIKRSDVTIQGEGSINTRFCLEGGVNSSLISIVPSNWTNFIHIRDCCLWGNKLHESGLSNGIYINGYAGDIFISNVLIDDFFDSAISILPVGRVWNVWIQDCEFEACQDGLLINATTGVQFIHVIDNYIFGNHGNGIEIRYPSVKAVNIEDDVIWGNCGHGVLLLGAQYVNIVGNQIFDNSYGSVSTHDGIYIGECSGQNSCFITIVGNTINNENFTRTQRYGINIENSTDNLTIVGNDLKGNNAGGVYISAGAAKNSVIASNLGYP